VRYAPVYLCFVLCAMCIRYIMRKGKTVYDID
jgi:hypothetical protein